MDETVLLLLSVFQWYDGKDDDCEEESQAEVTL